MVDAATNIAMERVKRESNQASIDADLDKAFSKENKGLAGGQKPIEATAPKQLNEIWTPRPHKM
jgi:hypothetical protein